MLSESNEELYSALARGMLDGFLTTLQLHCTIPVPFPALSTPTDSRGQRANTQ
jgi:hypothetical protein